MVSLLPGTEVSARGLAWEVVFGQALGAQTLYRLRGLQGAFEGLEVELLHPFETVQPVHRDFRPKLAGPVNTWLLYHQAFLLEQALGPSALLAVQPGRLKLEPYQLVPVLRAIRTSRARLLLADAVGLGKTVQAGLVLTELMARRLAHRVLIVAPAGPLLDQWRMEMNERFGLRLDFLDRARLEALRREGELGANPFDRAPLAIVSIDFLKQEKVLDQLERAAYDVVVIDEAHHCMDVGSAQDREDSQRRRLAEVLARRCDNLLLLTATPHDGNDRSFASLCELLDPSLLDGRGALRGEAYRAHVVRRLKSHIIDPQTKEPKFKKRQVHPCAVMPAVPKHHNYIALQKSLLDLIAPELRRAFRNRNYSDVLAFISLLKRSVSTVAACRQTLQVVAQRFTGLLREAAESQEDRRQRLKTIREYHRKLERFGVASQAESEEQSKVEAEELAQQLADLERKVRSGSRQLTKTASIAETLDNLVDVADRAIDEDPKLEAIYRLIGEIRKAEPSASILIYTEYVDSLNSLVACLKARGITGLRTMTGDDPEPARRNTTEQFRTQEKLILISTDAAAEGLNLHDRCHHLIHLELPFNPNRLEQRNGRIDRYGQKFEPIVRYLYLRGSFEERILLRLIMKFERQRERLTFVPNTLGLDTTTDIGGARLLKGLMDEDNRLFQMQPEIPDLITSDEPEASDEATQELLAEIDRSLKSFEQAARTHTWLGDAGLNAEARLAEEAETARVTGEHASGVDLIQFVCNAVQFDGGDVNGKEDDDVFALRLPPNWRQGLEGSIGYDPEDGTLRLTGRMDLSSDPESRPVGFLGRAHPVVRRALDRVRSLSFGTAEAYSQDHRVSAVKAHVEEPELILTFLGRVQSKATRELETILAIRVPKSGEPQPIPRADLWLRLAQPSNGIRTKDLWEQQFQDWADRAREAAKLVARRQFDAAARLHFEEHRKSLEAERGDLQAWLKTREKQVVVAAKPVAIQEALFGADSPADPATSWATLTEPLERLAAFASDRLQSPSKRSEAEGVLRLYRQREADLNARLELLPSEVIPLGILMVLPEEATGHGA